VTLDVGVELAPVLDRALSGPDLLVALALRGHDL
jgi:hypothetical protein